MNKGFIGFTSHILDEDFNRISKALACRRIYGKHTYEVLGKVIKEVLQDFKLSFKTHGIVTDNAANFLKTFREFGTQDDTENESDDIVIEESGEILDDGALVEETLELNSLPKHRSYACHSLNLVATKDSEKAMDDLSYKKVNRSAMAKCTALCSKQNRSSQFADLVTEKLGLKLVQPNSTRWNSTYESISRILRLLGESEHALTEVMAYADIAPFNREEKLFIREYCNIFKPFAATLNTLQGEDCTYIGYHYQCSLI